VVALVDVVVGGPIAMYGLDYENGDLFLGSFYVIVVLGALAIPTGAAREAIRQGTPLGRMPAEQETMAGTVS